MPSSIARVVRDDHARLPRLLRRVVTPGPSQERWRDELLRLLHAHRVAESSALTAEALAPAGDVAGAAALALDVLDHDLGDAVRALTDSPLDSPALAPLGERLGTLLDQHAALCDRLLHALEGAVARKQVRLLGGRYTAARDAVLQDDGAAEPPPRRLDLPRAELYELARKAGIEGRSSMSRGELIAELQQRQQHEPS